MGKKRKIRQLHGSLPVDLYEKGPTMRADSPVGTCAARMETVHEVSRLL